MSMGAAWRIHIGDHPRTLSIPLREQWPGSGPIDLAGYQSVTVTITRLSDRVQVQQSIATVTDEPGGIVQMSTVAAVSSLPGFCRVDASITYPTETRSVRAGFVLVEGVRPLTPLTQPPLDLGDDFVIQVTQWTPAGVLVVEVHRFTPDLVPVGTPTYWWDDPADTTDALVAWPGDPNTLLDTQP